jgi:hypothetical protein
MIREPRNTEKLTLSVTTKGGTTYERRDTTQRPFGEKESVVAFWDDDVIRIIPMSEVKEVVMHFD